MRTPIALEVDWSRAVDDRAPVQDARRGGYEFGQPAIVHRDGREVRGIVGWDPVLGWVVVFDRPVERVA